MGNLEHNSKTMATGDHHQAGELSTGASAEGPNNLMKEVLDAMPSTWSNLFRGKASVADVAIDAMEVGAVIWSGGIVAVMDGVLAGGTAAGIGGVTFFAGTGALEYEMLKGK